MFTLWTEKEPIFKTDCLRCGDLVVSVIYPSFYCDQCKNELAEIFVKDKGLVEILEKDGYIYFLTEDCKWIKIYAVLKHDKERRKSFLKIIKDKILGGKKND